MTPEVKKRIEQIRQGIVPEGYKKGKIGIVPIKWNEVPFSTLFTSTSEYTDDLKQYPLYSLTIEDGITAKTERYERSHLVKKENSYKVVRPNDYAYNPMNIRFGAVARHKGDIPVAVSGYYDIFTTVHESDLVFMDSFLTYGPMITYYNKVSTGSLVEKQRVHFSDFLEFSLALPPLEERKKIAEILSTQDKAIELQGRKIEELKRFKKGCLEKMFPKKGQKVPEKRFPGFTDDWEQRKLTEFVEFFSGLTYTPNDVQENGTLVLRSSNVSNGEVVDADNVYVNPQVVNSENVKVGDIVVVVRNGSRSLIGKHAQIKAFMPNTVIGAFMTGIRSECPEFTNALLNTSRFEEEIAMNMGATINQITGYMFSKMEFKVPCLDEQKEIGEYFENLDHLITLHQRKCVFLFGFFQAFISMIFTASTFSWEQRKLGDVVQITMGQSPDGSTYSDEPSDYILVQGNADLQNGWVCPRIWTTQITKKADAGDLIMSVRAPAGAMGKTAYNAVIGRGVAAIKGNEFIYQLLVKMDADGFWKTLSCGSTFESLNSDNIKNAEVKIPTTAEQIKIGGYFQQLDNLITLHQRELEKLQNIKKSMLEKMFV